MASSSPRRRELMSGCGLPYSIEIPRKEEELEPGETPAQMVVRLALQKAHEVAENRPRAWVIGADTTVVIDGGVLGKPRDKEEAVRMLGLIQGRVHEVWGGIAVVNRARSISHSECHSTRVKMMSVSRSKIESYVATGEPLDKAGSYAIQGIGAHLVESLEGSYSNVVGLNIAALISALCRLGAVTDE